MPQSAPERRTNALPGSGRVLGLSPEQAASVDPASEARMSWRLGDA
jgi:hypothetical protein